MLDKILLLPFICQIDAELLKVGCLKTLKYINIKNTDQGIWFYILINSNIYFPQASQKILNKQIWLKHLY